MNPCFMKKKKKLLLENEISLDIYIYIFKAIFHFFTFLIISFFLYFYSKFRRWFIQVLDQLWRSSYSCYPYLRWKWSGFFFKRANKLKVNSSESFCGVMNIKLILGRTAVKIKVLALQLFYFVLLFLLFNDSIKIWMIFFFLGIVEPTFLLKWVRYKL